MSGRPAANETHMPSRLSDVALKARAWAAAATVCDPEVPVLNIEDLGVLRDVRVDGDGRVEVLLTPTYSGCPAMDMIAVDVTGIAGVQVGDAALLWGPELPVEEIAAHAGSISYELLCAVSQRVPLALM